MTKSVYNDISQNFNLFNIILIYTGLLIVIGIFITKYIYNIFYDYSMRADIKLLEINNSIFLGTKWMPFLALQDASTPNYMCFYNRYLYKFYKNYTNMNKVQTNVSYKKGLMKIGDKCEINSDCKDYDYYSQNKDDPLNVICCKNKQHEDRKCSYIKDCAVFDECLESEDCLMNGYVYNLMRNKNDYKNKEICCNNKCVNNQLYDNIEEKLLCNNSENKLKIQSNINKETDNNTIFRNKFTYNQIKSKLKNNHSYSFWLYAINNISNLDTFFKTKFKELNKFLEEHDMKDYFENDVYNKNNGDRLIFSRGKIQSNENGEIIYGYPSVFINNNTIKVYYGSDKLISSFIITINKWTNVFITVNNKIVSVYVNGLLYKIIKINDITMSRKEHLYLLYTENKSGENGENGEIQGFSGFLNYFNYYNRTVKPNNIKNIYNNYLNNYIHNLSKTVKKFIDIKNKEIKVLNNRTESEIKEDELENNKTC